MSIQTISTAEIYANIYLREQTYIYSYDANLHLPRVHIRTNCIYTFFMSMQGIESEQPIWHCEN